MNLLLDASVLVPLSVAEARSDAVERYLGTVRPIIIVSDFAMGEAGAAIGALVRRRALTPEAADKAMANLEIFVSRSSRSAVTEGSDIQMAAKMVRRFDLGLRMPDALYLALAMRHKFALMTADVTLAKAARTFGIETVGPEF